MILLGDCLERLKELEPQSIDMILTDPPYGTTDADWDNELDFQKLWPELLRVAKENAPILLFGIEPFLSKVRLSNLKHYRYDWVWEKDKASNFIFANKQPGKVTEYCAVFYQKQPKYYSQKTLKPNGPTRQHLSPSHKQSGKAKSLMRNMPKHAGGIGTAGKDYEPDKLLGKNLVYFAREQRNRLHPTQKPVALCEHLIKCYSDEGDTVLDFTMGSGSTGVAAFKLQRKFIGIEMNQEYHDIAKCRIGNATKDNA